MRWPLRWTKKGVLKAEKSILVKRSKHKFVEWKRMRWKLVKEICTRRKSLAERNQSFPLFSDLNWVENVQRLRNIHEKWNFIVSIQNISSQSLAADKLIFQRFDRCWTERYTITSFSSCDVKTGPKNKWVLALWINQKCILFHFSYWPFTRDETGQDEGITG